MSSSNPTANDLLTLSDAARPEDAIKPSVVAFLRPFASLKMTCVLFLMAMFIVFVGSLAQARRDVWQVMEQYFRTYIAWIDVSDFFPPSMFPGLIDFEWDKLGIFKSFPFPGGWTIGWLMLANLITAHSLKFRLRARGRRLVGGLMVVGTGLLIMAAVILTGNGQTGVEFGNYVMSPDLIWNTLLGGMLVCGMIPLILTVTGSGRGKMERIVLGVIGGIVLLVFCYFVAGGESARLNLSSMRILWQLLKGAACAMVLLLGCNMLFDKRGGITLLHFGVAMLMFSELQVGMFASENMLTVSEGERTTWLRDIREAELAIIQPLPDNREKVVVIPQNVLMDAAAEDDDEQIIRVESLPFDIAVRKYFQNSQLREVRPNDAGTTDVGLGSFAIPVRLDPVTGMDESTDQPATYIDVIDRDSGDVIQSLLVAQSISELRGPPIAEVADIGGIQFEFYLRYQRNYRSYEVELVDVESTKYIGSSTAKDFRSTIVIRDNDKSEGEQFTLWMNNPLRYKGETFYQSGYNQLSDGTEVTTLSVVNNRGWMLPYIACMLVTFGMFGQFWQTLSRYLRRSDRSTASASVRNSNESSELRRTGSIGAILVPALLFLTFAGWVGSKGIVKPPKPNEMNLVEFARVPIAWSGRAQPVDSFARTQLLIISHKSRFECEFDPAELDANRDTIVEMFEKYWPSVKSDTLNEFSGTYPEWIAEMSRLTSSSEPAVEERMREYMVTPKQSAIRWFLDVVARPELAQRHRVIRIEDDQILAKLNLEKRHGLTYSMVEVQRNLRELDQANREANQLRRDEQESRMTKLQRRAAALFETVSLIDSMRNMFLDRGTSGLLEPMVDSWRILRILGNRPAVMGVPTGAEDEQQSWETVVASNSLRQFAAAMEQNNLSSLDDIPSFVETTLPAQLVSSAIVGSYRILKESAEANAEKDGVEFSPDAVNRRAAEAVSGIEDVFLRQVLAAIAASEPGTSAEDIVAGLTTEQMQQMASERISQSLFEIFGMLNGPGDPDPRLATVRANLQKLATQDEDALGVAMNLELAKLAVEDLKRRAGHLLPGGANASTFQNNANTVATVLTAWQAQDTAVFNAGVDTYLKSLETESIPHLNTEVLSTEAWFNHVEPFYLATCVYLPIILLTFLGWMFWPHIFRNSALWLMVLAFVIHTGALGMRMYISGRPPVTNLYSSAIFIGWAVVLASFVIEMMLKNGLGNLLGASVGAATLMIAHYLARDEGDTIGVMVAVLDTTFWLATHVVCITLGYAATFLAGFLGLIYVVVKLRDDFRRRRGTDFVAVDAKESGTVPTAPMLQMLGKLIYGVLCFAVFFSLVGTVLGGLWADDSWGRFWGWDPKENGAMMIVIWNALILHVRWDKMVRDYGTAVLAMAGNIVTAWSWFGVNELSAGLHDYGFTEGRLFALALFGAMQFSIILLAMVLYQSPKKPRNLPAT
jgi:cytochrome c-type biogenesis protein CcsB